MATQRKRGPAGTNLAWALQSLPLFDDPFLRMQALNLGIVHEFLVQIESQLLRDLVESEHTPPDTMFVSAVSQLWVFGLYELLRTWRQRAREVLTFADKVSRASGTRRRQLIAAKKRDVQTPAADALSAFHRWSQFDKARSKRFAQKVRQAVDRYERMFRRLEALRVSLAKHEMPKAHGMPALAPGYGRIDMNSGSIYWQVLLREMEVDRLTRRDIAKHCVQLATDRRRPILAPELQAKMERFTHETWHSYGIHRVTVTLRNGTEQSGVFIAWCKEVVHVEGQGGIPFRLQDIVEIRLS